MYSSEGFFCHFSYQKNNLRLLNLLGLLLCSLILLSLFKWINHRLNDFLLLVFFVISIFF
jgi:hypothetical protein